MGKDGKIGGLEWWAEEWKREGRRKNVVWEILTVKILIVMQQVGLCVYENC